jgi:hypothetical protein
VEELLFSDFYFSILHPVACIIRIVGNTVSVAISVVVRFIIFFSFLLLNMQNVGDVRQTEVPGPSRLEVEIGIAELKKY